MTQAPAIERFYAIGTPGKPWGPAEVLQWRARQLRVRSHATDVLAPAEALRPMFDVITYGQASGPDEQGGTATYPLVVLRSKGWQTGLPAVLVTGGVHGYETSGVQGVLQFAGSHAQAWAGRLNLLMVPCVSPWAYERVQRWNAHAVDPNRSFSTVSAATEADALMQLVAPLRGQFVAHIDLHETTDSDETEFRRAVAARDGKVFVPGSIPDGFYLVADAANPQPAFQQTIIEAVSRVTHIAAPDAAGRLIGSTMVAPGVIEYPVSALGLCAGITGAKFTTTTEVYPDSPRTTSEQCVAAQVAAIEAALSYVTAGPRPF